MDEGFKEGGDKRRGMRREKRGGEYMHCSGD
jgi:hypothetical protein